MMKRLGWLTVCDEHGQTQHLLLFHTQLRRPISLDGGQDLLVVAVFWSRGDVHVGTFRSNVRSASGERCTHISKRSWSIRKKETVEERTRIRKTSSRSRTFP
jgi:hypothetical protein